MRAIQTNEAPDSIGPFSQGVVDNGTAYVSGQGPIDPDTGEVVSEDVQEQTQQTLANVNAILQAVDASLSDVVKVTIFLTDMDTYDAVNEVYAEHMSEPFPARSAIEVTDLPVDIGVEIEVVASV